MRFSTFVHGVLIVCIPVFFVACTDKKDESPPRVTIERPFENELFNSVDTLKIEATLTDNEKVVSAVIELLDMDFNTLSISKSVTVSGSDVQLATDFVIDAPYLESGPRYVAVRASDGENVGSGYVAIQLSAVPREVQGYYAVTHSNNQTQVWHLAADADQFELAHDRYADFAGAALNYRLDILGLAGRLVGDAVFYDTEDWEAIRVVPGMGGQGLPYFTGLRYAANADRFLLWRYDEFAYVFDGQLQQLNSFPTLPNHVPTDLFVVGDRYYAIEKELISPQYSLTSYSETGLLLDNLSIAGKGHLVSPKDDHEVFVWLDTPDGVRLEILNKGTGLLSSPYQRPGATLHDVVEIDTGLFALLTSDGLLTFDYNTGQTVVVSSSATSGILAYDDLSGQFWVADSTAVSRYAPLGALLQTHTFTDPVVAIDVDYNR